MECNLCKKQLLSTEHNSSKSFGIKSNNGNTYCIECYDVYDWAPETNTNTKTIKLIQKPTPTPTENTKSIKSTNYVKVYCSKCKNHFEESKCVKCGFKNPLFR